MSKILGSKVQCVFCLETSTTEGRGEEKGGSANARTKHTEPLTQGFCSPLYVWHVYRRPPYVRVPEKKSEKHWSARKAPSHPTFARNMATSQLVTPRYFHKLQLSICVSPAQPSFSRQAGCRAQAAAARRTVLLPTVTSVNKTPPYYVHCELPQSPSCLS